MFGGGRYAVVGESALVYRLKKPLCRIPGPMFLYVMVGARGSVGQSRVQGSTIWREMFVWQGAGCVM